MSWATGASPYSPVVRVWTSTPDCAKRIRAAMVAGKPICGLTIQWAADGVDRHYTLSDGGQWVVTALPESPIGHANIEVERLSGQRLRMGGCDSPVVGKPGLTLRITWTSKQESQVMTARLRDDGSWEEVSNNHSSEN